MRVVFKHRQRHYRASITDAWGAVRRHEGLDTILAVVAISALVILVVWLIRDVTPARNGAPATPPSAYHAQ